MARKVKKSTNPKLAQEHKKGAVVRYIKTLIHKNFGVIGFEFPHYWLMHYNYMYRSGEILKSLHQEIVKLPVDASNSRTLLNEPNELLWQIYHVGMDMVDNAVLCAKHLVLSIEHATKSTPTGREELSERLISALKKIGFRDLSKDIGFQRLAEIINVRDRLWHPTLDNLNGSSETDWDTVPLAWMLSEKAIEAFEVVDPFLVELIDFWFEKSKDYKETKTFNVQRAIQFDHNFKKPPKE